MNQLRIKVIEMKNPADDGTFEQLEQLLQKTIYTAQIIENLRLVLQEDVERAEELSKYLKKQGYDLSKMNLSIVDDTADAYTKEFNKRFGVMDTRVGAYSFLNK